MAARTLEAPLDISLDGLQTGIQNQEDGGFKLVDLSKGSKGKPPAVVFINLAVFEPRTEPMADVQLVETPPNLFLSTGPGHFSVDPTVSAAFVQQMVEEGMDVKLYSPVVSINGKDTSLAVVRPAEYKNFKVPLPKVKSVASTEKIKKAVRAPRGARGVPPSGKKK
jgi:hypothetical protein